MAWILVGALYNAPNCAAAPQVSVTWVPLKTSLPLYFRRSIDSQCLILAIGITSARWIILPSRFACASRSAFSITLESSQTSLALTPRPSSLIASMAFESFLISSRDRNLWMVAKTQTSGVWQSWSRALCGSSRNGMTGQAGTCSKILPGKRADTKQIAIDML